MTTGTQSDTGARHGPAADTGSTAQDKAREAAIAAKDRAGEMWSGTKEQARSKLNEQKDMAADRIGGVAESLRESSRKPGGEGDPIARVAGNQPVAFFGLALAAGFIAVRAMRDIGDINR